MGGGVWGGRGGVFKAGKVLNKIKCEGGVVFMVSWRSGVRN